MRCAHSPRNPIALLFILLVVRLRTKSVTMPHTDTSMCFMQIKQLMKIRMRTNSSNHQKYILVVCTLYSHFEIREYFMCNLWLPQSCMVRQFCEFHCYFQLLFYLKSHANFLNIFICNEAAHLPTQTRQLTMIRERAFTSLFSI